MLTPFCVLSFLLSAVTQTAPAATQACQVWSVTDTRHVLRSEPAAQDREVKLSVARNEWRDFQILLRAEVPVTGIRIAAADLRGPNGAVFSASNFRLYRQHQVWLKQGTERNDSFKPDWYPDPLIPFVHPLTGAPLEGGRLRAVPFDLPAQETQGFWIDVYVPVTTSPGDYQGTIELTFEKGQSIRVPVRVTVWNFALPEVPTLQTEFGSPVDSLRSYYRKRTRAGQEKEPTDWKAVEAECAQLMSDHRLNAVPPGPDLQPKLQPDGTFALSAAQLTALRQFIDRYHVNALQVPHPSSAIKDPDSEKERLQKWLAAFDRASEELQRTNLIFYTYLRDEPNTLEDYRYVQKWGRAIRAAKSVVKVLVVEQTWTAPGFGGADSAWGDLYGAVDIWCPLFSLHRQESAAQRQALGETVWTYTALCQGKPTPWWHIDFPLLNYRVPAWIAWRNHMKGLLYWGGLSYWGPVEDPWTEAPYYTGNGVPQQGARGVIFNGEGSLVYPARAVGFDGIVPTIRLKALRDSIEDYEYLAILERHGKAAQADQIVKPMAESFFSWDKNPAAYDAARFKLAELILMPTK